MTAISLPRCLLASLLLLAPAAQADNLFTPGNWPALASDRNAHKVGDVLTILVYESATAIDSANTGQTRSTNLGGHVTAGSTLGTTTGGTPFDQSASLAVNNDADNSATTGRSGGMIAQITATVDEVLPSGDLRISGAQVLDINGDKTNIKIKGRVRQADISALNTVVSSRLADATIDYDGAGFVARGAKTGILTNIFNWLGIL
jgi:flagellar L-ring protein FlgH